jgi:S1-C subfamily serine protease
MQDHVRGLAKRLIKTTVAVQVGNAQGSGVIVSPGGYVLTAAHVIGRSNQEAVVVLYDGRRVPGTTLGTYRSLDAGLLKIDVPLESGESWPHAAMGDSSSVALGQWCLAMGHPGGIQENREPSLRLGRILTVDQNSALRTDCTLIGGDSGGPLFNMRGEVIGVNSRIGGSLTANLHVPVNVFRDSWDRLAEGDNWGHIPGNQPFIGVQGEADSTDARISRVFANSPAEKAGIREGDLIIRFAGKPVGDFESLRRFVAEQEPGSKVDVVVRRGDRRLTIRLAVGRLQE